MPRGYIICSHNLALWPDFLPLWLWALDKYRNVCYALAMNCPTCGQEVVVKSSEVEPVSLCTNYYEPVRGFAPEGCSACPTCGGWVYWAES